MSLNAQDMFSSSVDWGHCEDGVFNVDIELPPWSTKPAKFQFIELLQGSTP